MDDIIEFGRRVELLGKAMQNPDSTLPELVSLAHDCGLSMQFRVVDAAEAPGRDADGDGRGK